MTTSAPRSVATLAVASLVAGLLLLTPAPAGALVQAYAVPVLVRATDSKGAQMPHGAGATKLSADGRWLAFTNALGFGTWVKDLLSGTTTLVSRNEAGAAANNTSQLVGISADGSKVAFTTGATNLGKGSATASDLYVLDRATNGLTRANVVPGGGTAAVTLGTSSFSAGGKVVAFVTTTHLGYARNLANNTSERFDVTSSEVAGNAPAETTALNADGRFVAFTSVASDLVAGDTNGSNDVFLRDRQAGTTVRVSLSDTGQLDGPSPQAAISADGRFIAFCSYATNAVEGDTNGLPDVFVRDRQLLATTRVSVSGTGAQSTGSSYSPSISDDGEFVAFASAATNLATPPATGLTAIIRRDVTEGYTVQMGRSLDPVPANGSAQAPSISADGAAVAFVSSASALVPGDTNALPDAFVDRLEPLGPFAGTVAFTDRQVADFGAPAASKAAHRSDVRYGRSSPTHLIVALAHDAAWAKDRQPVARLYQAFFHREPDLGGLNYWVHKHVTGTKLSRIAASFAGSSEFKTAYGTVGNSAFVTLVYANVLQRKPDSGGLAHWTKKLDAGMSRGDLMVAFSESSEGGRVLAPEVDSVLIGLGMLGAMPSLSQYAEAAAAQRALGAPEGAASIYLASSAYALHVATTP